jgi:hypothetical protein
MKIAACLMLGLALLAGGCASAARVRADTRRHREISRGMSKEAVVALLGAPQHASGSRWVWETSAGTKNFTRLEVTFSPSDTVARLHHSHGALRMSAPQITGSDRIVRSPDGLEEPAFNALPANLRGTHGPNG